MLGKLARMTLTAVLGLTALAAALPLLPSAAATAEDVAQRLAFADEGPTEEEVLHALDGIEITPAASCNEKAFGCLEKGLEALSTRIDVSGLGLGAGDIEAAYTAVKERRPDLFYLDGYTLVYKPGTRIVSSIKPKYTDRTAQLEIMRSAYEDAVAEALAYAASEDTESGKARALHDWLAYRCEYDTENAAEMPAVEQTAYGALVGHRAVCTGYSKAYQDLLSRVGIECGIAVSEGMGHSWNIARVGGAWRHVDVTYDDTAASDGTVHKYLFRTDRYIAEEGYYGWSAAHRCE